MDMLWLSAACDWPGCPRSARVMEMLIVSDGTAKRSCAHARVSRKPGMILLATLRTKSVVNSHSCGQQLRNRRDELSRLDDSTPADGAGTKKTTTTASTTAATTAIAASTTAIANTVSAAITNAVGASRGYADR